MCRRVAISRSSSDAESPLRAARSEKDRPPVSARIFAIVDVFDALTSKRPYKDPLSFEETMKILHEGKGTHFDTTILDAFNQIASSLYEQFSNREDETLKTGLSELTQKYFSEDFDSILLRRKN